MWDRPGGVTSFGLGVVMTGVGEGNARPQVVERVVVAAAFDLASVVFTRTEVKGYFCCL